MLPEGLSESFPVHYRGEERLVGAVGEAIGDQRLTANGEPYHATWTEKVGEAGASCHV